MQEHTRHTAQQRAKKLGEVIRFAGTFAKSPRKVGALIPSSPALASAMVSGLDWDSINSVVEYGSGTGAITGAILDAMDDNSQFIAIEYSRKFAEVCKSIYPDICLHVDTVANVKTICQSEGLSEVDCIISSLPWAVFTEKEQTTYLNATLDVLSTEGSFTTFSYVQSLATPGVRRFLGNLKRNFYQVSQAQIVWKNFPPAVVIRCKDKISIN